MTFGGRHIEVDSGRLVRKKQDYMIIYTACMYKILMNNKIIKRSNGNGFTREKRRNTRCGKYRTLTLRINLRPQLRFTASHNSKQSRGMIFEIRGLHIRPR